LDNYFSTGVAAGRSAKAAEGRRTPRRWRAGYGSRVREASGSAPAPWRFPASARCSGIGNGHVTCHAASVFDFLFFISSKATAGA